MARILDDRIREWTGEQWQIVVSEEQGAATLKQVETAELEQNIADAENDPVVAAALRMFPNSKILDVRFAASDDDDGLDLDSVQEAAIDNPDQVADQDDRRTARV